MRQTLLVALLVAIALPGVARADTLVYTNDFTGPVGSEWSSNLVSTTPAGARPYLGQFGPAMVTLDVPGALPAHDTATVAFDLFLIESWDGPQCGGCGPDSFRFTHDGGLDATEYGFCNTEEAFHSQSYPDPLSLGSAYACGTGADEVNTLGFAFYGDSVYRLSFTFPHTSSDLVAEFTGLAMEGIGNEGWGITNVDVSVHETPLPPDPPVPEATTLALVGVGVLAVLAVAARRR